MRKKTKSEEGACVYCGQIQILTRDHIPPKNLFSEPRPSDLVSVPSCLECNNKASLDDEYFQVMLAMRADLYQRADISQISPTILKSLMRPQKERFRQRLSNKIHFVEARTPSGLFLGKKPAYEVNLARLNKVVQRITMGLFYRERGKRISDNYSVFSHHISEVVDMPQLRHRIFIENSVLPFLASLKPKEIGNGVFSYRASFNPTDQNMSFWLFVFYEEVLFFSSTLPNDAPDVLPSG